MSMDSTAKICIGCIVEDPFLDEEIAKCPSYNSENDIDYTDYLDTLLNTSDEFNIEYFGTYDCPVIAVCLKKYTRSIDWSAIVLESSIYSKLNIEELTNIVRNKLKELNIPYAEPGGLILGSMLG